MRLNLMRGVFHKFGVLGSFVHSVRFGELQVIENGLLICGNNGIIENLIDLKLTPVGNHLSQLDKVIDYSGKLIVPGFVDAHCHAPQYVFTGTGMDLPLLAWLEKYTFPCEAKFSNEDFAKFAYEKSVRRHLKCGTTFASYFATIHNGAGKVLVDVINKVGQRAFVGKVSMDRNCPDFYIEDTKTGGEDAEEFVRYVLAQSPAGLEHLRRVDSLSGVETVLDDFDVPAVGAKRSRTMSESLESEDSDTVRLFDVTRSAAASAAPSTAKVSVLNAGLLQKAGQRPVKYRSISMDSTAELGTANGGVPLMHAISMDEDNMPPMQVMAGHSSSPYVAPFVTPATSSSTHKPSFHSAGDLAARLGLGSDVSISEDSNSNMDRGSTSGVTDGNNSELSSIFNTADTPRILPVVTPRFVPTCTGDIMLKLSEIAAKYGLPIQSHLSESPGEIAWVAELHPDCPNYASVYDKFKLLGEHSYMAHCCYCTPEERKLMKERGTGVVHCASSNFALNSGVMDVRVYKDEGIKVAIGTDVAGGYSPSMLDALRQTIIASRVKGFEHRNYPQPVPSDATSGKSSPAPSDSDALSSISAASSAPAPTKEYRSLNFMEAFHLITVGGAEVLGMDRVLGNFLPGKKFDGLVVDVAAENSPIDVFPGESVLDHFEKFLFLGDDRNIQHVYVDGKQVL